ncbi:hypothetical protein CRG98_020525 [Punica granatum]|uniref:RNase H type-1 domain-containing protein n=1 Tax=Punica granatum TaxID=22663 RepID=A0A2I0JT48_PUNGR|nr:hypothetical protein CRG98_020525 [Punica granatum]
MLRMRRNIDLNSSPNRSTTRHHRLLSRLRYRRLLSTITPYPTSSPSISAPGFENSSANTTSLTSARTIAPGLNFDPTTQDQSKQCEYHRGAPGHTLDTCWRLWERIQEMIDAKELSFNAVRPPNVQANPLPNHGQAQEPSINMINICVLGEDESGLGNPSPFIIKYVLAEVTVGSTRLDASPTPFVIDVPAKDPYLDNRIYENPMVANKGKAPVVETGAAPEIAPFPPKKVTNVEAEVFMKIIKASEYKLVEQMAKSLAHISLLALLLSLEPHWDALLWVLTAAQVPKETPPDRIEETVSSIFSNTISFSDDELPSEGWAHSRALHIFCKCNNYVIGRVMIDNGSALNICMVTTLKQMNVDLNRVRLSKTAVRAFDGSRRKVNGEIDLLIDIGPCSFSITFQVLSIPNAFILLLGRPWIHSVGAVPSFLHQRLKFIVEEKLIMVKGEEDYAIYKETAVPYISVGDDENLPFHSFETISVIRDYGEIGPSRADRMIRKVLLRHNYIPGVGLGARGQGINRPIEIIEARRGNHLHRLATHYGRLNRGIQVPPLSHFFPGPAHIIGSTLDGPSSGSDDTPAAPPAVYAVTEEIPSGVHIRLAQENEELNNYTSVPRYSALHSNPNLRHVDSNPFEECLSEPQPVYFGEGLPEDGQVPEIEESLRHLKDHQLTSVEPTEEINLGTEEEPCTLKIETGLDPAQRARMIDFLREYQEVFAWSYDDVLGLDPSIVKHFFPLDTEKFPPKRGKERPKAEEDNKASPKENFPLPHIDVLVDNTVRHAQFSFMEGFSGYNQIRMAEEDKIKTTFTMMWGTFCYRVMPFGLKNARATYQRAMVTLFHGMMHKEVEVYVDDMIAKSKEGEDHLVNLKRLFDCLKEYKLRFNPAKCTFGSRSGKLLGFVVSERGIEVDPDKVKAIKELPPPSTVREVHGFLRRLNYIARFIANLTDKCQPLFRLLRKNAAIKWDHECQNAFDTIKAYLVQPPVLVTPMPNQPLILYLTVRRQSLGCMLGQEDESTHKERAIYYLSKKFTEGESNYLEIEKLCCSLVWVMQRLRQYTLYHTIRLLSKANPLRYLLDSPSSMRNIAKWCCQLTKHDIVYVSRTSIKGQAIADHLAEFPISDDTPINADFPDERILQVDDEKDEPTWRMYFDGAVNSAGSGVGAVLISPDGRYYPVAAKVDFSCTNNVAEYEACIIGLQAAIDFKVKELEVFGDSMLTIFQTLGQWKTKDAKLVPYHEYLEELAKNFEKISFTYTPRTKNQFADALATLASMASITKGNIIEPLEIEVAKGLVYCDAIEATDAKPWYEDIKNFL